MWTIEKPKFDHVPEGTIAKAENYQIQQRDGQYWISEDFPEEHEIAHETEYIQERSIALIKKGKAWYAISYILGPLQARYLSEENLHKYVPVALNQPFSLDEMTRKPPLAYGLNALQNFLLDDLTRMVSEYLVCYQVSTHSIFLDPEGQAYVNSDAPISVKPDKPDKLTTDRIPYGVISMVSKTQILIQVPKGTQIKQHSRKPRSGLLTRPIKVQLTTS